MGEPAQARRRPPRRPPAVELAGIEPVSTTRLPDNLAVRIRDLIISEQIEQGARLPSERDLAERFGASRPTVSQALRSLSLMGLVEIRRGSGAYVLRRPQATVAASIGLMLDLDQHSVDHLMRLRLWLETIGTREAVAREPAIGEPEIQAIWSALSRLRGAAGRTAELIAADTVFHATIVSGGGNPYLTAMDQSA